MKEILISSISPLARLRILAFGFTLMLLGLKLSAQVTLPFESDFEPTDGYTTGFFEDTPPWVSSAEGVNLTDLMSASGVQAVTLDGLAELAALFSATQGDIVYVDFYLKPSVMSLNDLPTEFDSGVSLLTTVVALDPFTGEIYTTSGFGDSSGGWFPTNTFVDVLDEITTQWQRFTFRLDYSLSEYDLFLEATLIAYGLPFLDNSVTQFSQFSAKQYGEKSSALDFIYFGYENPLFLDIDKDNLPDDFESLHGLNPNFNDRYLDPDHDELLNIEEYMLSTGPMNPDSDNDGVSDFKEYELGADPLVADVYTLSMLPFTDDFETYTLGEFPGGSNWAVEGLEAPQVQSLKAFEGSQALEFYSTEDAVIVTNDFNGNGMNPVWISFRLIPTPFKEIPEPSDRSAALFYFNEAGIIQIHDNDSIGGWVSLEHEPADLEAWQWLTLKMDYTLQRWSLWLNGVRVAENIIFSHSSPYFSEFKITNYALSNSFIDALSITANEPTGLDNDGDLLLNSEEDLNGNGIVDAGETDPNNIDSDRDGIVDASSVNLQLWLTADKGVQTDESNKVTSWADQSGNGNDAVQYVDPEQPLLISSGLGAYPIIRFDGSSDYLEGTSGFDPSESDYTIVIVQKRTGGHDYSAPFSFSNTASALGAPLLRYGPGNNEFGVNAVGYGQDGTYVDLGSNATNEFNIASIRRLGGSTLGNGGHLSLRVLTEGMTYVAAGVQNWDSQSSSGFYLGKKKANNTHMFGGDVAEVLVYDSSLTDEQLLALKHRLSQKYAIDVDQDADGISDSWELHYFSSLEQAAESDSDGDNVSLLREYNLGSDPTVVEDFGLVQGDADLKLWLKADQGVTMDANGYVSSWADLSGYNQDAQQAASVAQPIYIANALNGYPVLRFDGINDYLDGISEYDASASTGLTMVAVHRRTGGAIKSASFSYSTATTEWGAPLMRWGPVSGDFGINEVGVSQDGVYATLLTDSPTQYYISSIRRDGGVMGNGASINVRMLGSGETFVGEGTQTWASGSTEGFSIGKKKADNNEMLEGDIAEIIVFNRALTDEEIYHLEGILGAKYDISLDIDADSLIDSIEYDYFGDLNQGAVGDFDQDGLSNIREIRLGYDPTISNTFDLVLGHENLKMWFVADQAFVDENNQVEFLPDLSGYENHASQMDASSRPLLTLSNIISEERTMNFDGIDDYLEGNTDFDISVGDYTIALVHRRTGGHEKSSPFSFSTTASQYGAPLMRWGPEVGYFGINDVGHSPEGKYLQVGSSAENEYFISTVRSQTTDNITTLSLTMRGYVGYFETTGIQTWQSPASNNFTIGKKKYNNTDLLQGEVAEVIVFNASLTGQELSEIEAYLMQKYEITDDLDGDGLNNLAEDINNNRIVDLGETDPHNPDSDFDGIWDQTEIALNLDPLIDEGHLLLSDNGQNTDTSEVIIDFELAENFALGNLDSQNGWKASNGVTVTDVEARDSIQSIGLESSSIVGEYTSFERTFNSGNEQQIWITFYGKLQATELPDPSELSGPTSALFGISENGVLSAYKSDEQVWLESELEFLEPEWTRYILLLDYDNKTWKLIVGDKLIFNDFPFLDDSLNDFSRMKVLQTGRGLVTSAFIDKLTVSNKEPEGLDFDQDGLVNSVERAIGTNLYLMDSDLDLISDLFEYENSLDPLDPSDASDNYDGDAFNNYQEYLFSADPYVADSEGQPGVVGVQVWDWVEKNWDLSDLVNYSRFPYRPDRVVYMPTLEIPKDFSHRYATRTRGFIVPPESGNYVFWLSADNEAELRLSSSQSVFDLEKVASVPHNTGFREFTKYALQESLPITLEAGQLYAFEVRHIDTGAMDHMSVAWSIEGQPRRLIENDDVVSWKPDPLDLDDDSLLDSWEIANGIDANKSEGADGYNGDVDGDGLTNFEEYTYNTNPTSFDSDGNGYSDYTEIVDYGTDPLVSETIVWKNIQNLAPTSAIILSGNWKNFAEVLYSEDSAGKLKYHFNLSEAGIYQAVVNLMRIQESEVSPNWPLNFLYYIDGEFVGRSVVAHDSEVDIQISQKILPYLGAGAHELVIHWENVYRGLEIGIESVQLNKANSDSEEVLADWVSDKIGRETDITGPSSTSAVSPYCLEGRGRYLTMMSNNVGVPFERGSGDRWYFNLPLSPIVPTDFSVSFQNEGKTSNGQIEWVDTNILDGGDLMLRQGDSLKLVAQLEGQLEGSSVTFNIGGESHTLSKDTPLIYQFNEPGHVDITVDYVLEAGSAHHASIGIEVVGITIPEERPAIWRQRVRHWTWEGVGPNVVIEADEIEIFERARTASEVTLRLFRDEVDESRAIVARLGENGPILHSVITDGFWLRASVEGTFRSFPFDETTSVVINDIYVSEIPESVEIDIDIFKVGVVLDDGTSTRDLFQNDFGEFGHYRLEMYKPFSVSGSSCHHIRAYQNGEYIGIR